MELRAHEVPPGHSFYHGTKADLAIGDLLAPGGGGNFRGEPLRHIYFTATLDAAIWGAELARGDGPERIYIVEATGPFEDDPNLTDKRFPGNVTASYRSLAPLRVVGEVAEWQGHSATQIKAMKDGLAKLAAEGNDTIED